MSQLDSALRDAADKNHELLSELSQTDFAPSSLKQNTSYISDLKSQIAATDKELSRLHQITEDEKKDHVKYRDSNVKRWAHKLGGQKGKEKFTSKQEKEEKEFMEAWQKERSAKESRDELGRALGKAETDRVHLESEAARHDRAQTALDALYQSIFSGPTPDVPGEDQMENNVQQARGFFGQCQTQVGTEQKALEAMQRADYHMKLAYRDIGDALRRSTRDMFGGGTFTDMAEREALSHAQNNMQHVIRHMEEARRNQPAIHPLSEITIDQGHLFSDVLFDNIFTDMAQHERIQQSEQQMQAAIHDLQIQLGEQQNRKQGADAQLRDAAGNLENAREELQRIRAEAFKHIGANGVPPPAYQ
ncbi:uncharacterized protein RCC_04850 [Ramularia collo-cygni]|uniref:Uncharacterized protein n=1 Tax=Ramularia collo-cygni TaxID=112498 RepID=A0A2D3UXE7_9PEZI|nr:uncharacterized protein RCC_04850 [Ramularia collo-cygni]CZT19005.1 uncharacterized protein RCC_04850 [Ramularia collo-cygni]